MALTEQPQKHLRIEQMASLKSWGDPPKAMAGDLNQEAIIDCGWGRLIFGQTFTSGTRLANTLLKEQPGQRDIILYSRDPQVVVSKAPQELFIDPSLTYRLELPQADIQRQCPPDVMIRPVAGHDELKQINRIYKARNMVPLRSHYHDYLIQQTAMQLLVAVDTSQHQILGCVTGVDHHQAFEDPDNGSSLWALAVDPQCSYAGIGTALVAALANYFRQSGRAFMDLSVMHDNQEAISLYEKMGFYQVPAYCIKTRNSINEKLYVGPQPEETLNIYGQIIVDEAARRGIIVKVTDAAKGFFSLSLGGRTIHCRESLSDLTSAVAMSRCDDKTVTHQLLAQAGLKVPAQQPLDSENDALNFLQEHGRIVIKPAQGEQGNGVFVDLKTPLEVKRAYSIAAQASCQVIGEVFHEGQDLRIVVINHEVVAAAIRKPAFIIGDGRETIAGLIRKQSRRRRAATGGESTIPADDETRRCIADAHYLMSQVLPEGQELQVRKTANLHTGGTLHDVTDQLHPALAEAAQQAAAVLDIPVVGLDLIVASADSPDYVFIEANERPGLANHEPQPTAERFIDMLFPQTQHQRR